jgi:hypothetical protein
MQCVHSQFSFGEGGVNEVCRQAVVCTVLCETSKQTVSLSEHQDGGHSSTGIPEILVTEASIAEI